MKVYIVFIIVFLSLHFTNTNAQDIPSPPKNEAVEATSNDALMPNKILIEDSAGSPAKAQNEIINRELLLLREQNKLIKSHQASLLSTVHWSLGVLVTVAALLVGFGWWTNFRMHEADKERLKKEVKSDISELEGRVTVQLSKARELTQKDSEARINRAVDNIAKDIVGLESKQEKANDKADLLSESVSSLTKKVGDNLAESKKGILSLEEELRLVEELVWDLKGIPNNVLITQWQSVRLAMEVGNEDRASKSLARLKSTLEKFASDKNYVMKPVLFEGVMETLKIAEKSHPINTTEIRGVLSTIPVDKE